MTRYGAWLAAGLALVAAAGGCASARKARARELESQLEGFRYQKPLDEVWQQARVLLAERGYPLAAADANAVGQPEMSWVERLASPARATSFSSPERDLFQALGMTEKTVGGEVQWLDTGWNGYGERYHVEGPKDAGGCRVIFTHIQADRTDRRDKRSRDLDMELDLVKQVDPEAAARIEAALEAVGKDGG
jgi:hypothetical protein